MKKLADNFIQELNSKKTWLKISGSILSLIGIISILLFSLPIIRFQGFNFLMVSVIFFIHAFYFNSRKSGGILIYTLVALFYAFMAISFLYYFEWRVYIFVLFIGAFFIFGLYKIYLGCSQINFHRGWVFSILAGIFNIGIAIYGMYHFNDISRLFMIFALYLDILLTGMSFIALGTKSKWLNAPLISRVSS